MLRRSLAVALLAVGLAFVTAGCGGSSTPTKEEHAASIVTARDRVDFALAAITTGHGTVEDLVQRMETAADRIDETAADLDDAGAAEGFDDETSELVTALHQFAADLAGLAADAGQPGNESLLTNANALQFPSWVKANQVLASLEKQGIAVKPIGSH